MNELQAAEVVQTEQAKDVGVLRFFRAYVGLGGLEFRVGSLGTHVEFG